jgi:hypothetical protein
MKYKVVLFNHNAASDTDKSANFSFYTGATATQCCLSWVELFGPNTAFMFNGVDWLAINP